GERDAGEPFVRSVEAVFAGDVTIPLALNHISDAHPRGRPATCTPLPSGRGAGGEGASLIDPDVGQSSFAEVPTSGKVDARPLTPDPSPRGERGDTLPVFGNSERTVTRRAGGAGSTGLDSRRDFGRLHADRCPSTLASVDRFRRSPILTRSHH